MNRTRLGLSDLRISRLGLGTVQLGMPYGYDNQDPPSDDAVVRLIHRAVDLGINYIDTAAGYGRSEELVGLACRQLSQPPVIATKLSIADPQNGHLLTGSALRQTVEQSVHNSLRTLHLDALDLLQLHSLQTEFATAELLELLDSFRTRGLVRHWGVTTYGEKAPHDALNHPKSFVALQIPYSALDRRMETNVLPRCRDLDCGVILRSVFLQGVLSDRLESLPPRLAPLRELSAPLQQLSRAADLSLGELALRFAAFSTGAHSTIFGTTSIAELEDNIRAMEAGPLSPELISAVRDLEIEDPTLLDPSNWPR